MIQTLTSKRNLHMAQDQVWTLTLVRLDRITPKIFLLIIYPFRNILF